MKELSSRIYKVRFGFTGGEFEREYIVFVSVEYDPDSDDVVSMAVMEASFHYSAVVGAHALMLNPDVRPDTVRVEPT